MTPVLGKKAGGGVPIKRRPCLDSRYVMSKRFIS